MKKIKKALAILLTAMMISACGVLQIYAEEVATEPTAAQKEKITDFEEIEKMISDYIKEQKFFTAFNIFISDHLDGINKMVFIESLGEPQFTEIEEWLKIFMKVKNIDETKVQYGVVEIIAPNLGDVYGDYKINVRDCAYIARELAKGEKIDITGSVRGRNVADFNFDGVVNIRDAAAIAKYLVTEKVTDSNKAMNLISNFVKSNKYSVDLKHENNVVTVGVNWKNAGTIENIKAFALRENIDEKLIKYVVQE